MYKTQSLYWLKVSTIALYSYFVDFHRLIQYDFYALWKTEHNKQQLILPIQYIVSLKSFSFIVHASKLFWALLGQKKYKLHAHSTFSVKCWKQFPKYKTFWSCKRVKENLFALLSPLSIIIMSRDLDRNHAHVLKRAQLCQDFLIRRGFPLGLALTVSLSQYFCVNFLRKTNTTFKLFLIPFGIYDKLGYFWDCLGHFCNLEIMS